MNWFLGAFKSIDCSLGLQKEVSFQNQMPNPIETLHLLPRPKKITPLGGIVHPKTLPVLRSIDGSAVEELGEEAYSLKINQLGIWISARSDAGLRYGDATLKQLESHETVPCMVIQDAPLFEHRGVMLDISRDRVPRMKTLFELIDRLASWKINHLQLYIEHAFAYQGHECVWRAASPITPDELEALDTYARSKGIVLAANQNCLGHMERWLKHPRYAPLGERDRGTIVMAGEMFGMPGTLCPTDPKSLLLVEDLLSQLLPICSSAYANIGCDEPWDLGKGRSLADCESRGRDTIFSEYLAKVAGISRRLGKRPQFWCDPHPNEGDQLPKDLVALVWGYEFDDEFESRATAHRNAGREVWVAPGTTCWQTILGRTWNRRANLDKAADMSRLANGFLCTAWGDQGHRQAFPLTLFGFADAAMAAWSGAGAYDDVAVGWHAFDNPSLGPWLANLGNLDQSLCLGECPDFSGEGKGTKIVNRCSLFSEMHTSFFERKGNGGLEEWQEIHRRIQQARESFPTEQTIELAKDECLWMLDLASWVAERAVARRASQPEMDFRKVSVAKMVDLLATFRRLWLERSRYGGLEESSAYFFHFHKNW
jgi:hexosaminidase